LLSLIDGTKRPRDAFVVGWWFGFGHFSAGVYWISYAMLVDAAHFGWMIPFAVFGLGGFLALYSAVAAWISRRFAAPGLERIVALAGAWTLMEWVRSWLFTGFPWNLLGTVWVAATPVLQFAAIGGVYGLSALTVLCAGMPSILGSTSKRPLVPLLGSIGLLAGIAAWGACRVPNGPAPTQHGIRLRLVQPNIEQTLKWKAGLAEVHLLRNLDLSLAPGFDHITDVVWPETAAPNFLAESPADVRRLVTAIPPGGLLLTGTVRGTADSPETFQIFNSLQVLDGNGDILDSYDKAHLVPFGEYVPLRHILPLEKLTPGGNDYQSGSGPTTLHLPGLPPVSVMICYEAIFPAAASAAERPDWLLNITNDGWFGLSAGPYQHLAAAQLRAVEQGLPLARDANTGISAMIDPYGRIVADLPLGTSGVLDSELPLPLNRTIFSQVQKATVVTILVLQETLMRFIPR
jgi:apolipoprotein N-acyltransferase